MFEYFSLVERETRAGAQSVWLDISNHLVLCSRRSKFRKFNINHQVLYAGAAGGQIHLIKSMTVGFEAPWREKYIKQRSDRMCLI